ncbi:hypothetical protein QIH80_27020 [Bradyrhizobium elkanii]|nr:hypothetical protein QIH80_27020 [Bradyrhizobium elkanii]
MEITADASPLTSRTADDGAPVGHFGHRVHAVDHEVKNDLLQLDGVAFHPQGLR